MKVFRNGVIVGRFQHVHIGHEKLIKIGLDLCEKLLIFVGSADSKKSDRNPYSVEYRINLISKIYENEINEGRLIIKGLNDLTDENDLTPLWGEYVLDSAKKILNESPKCIIYGKDKNIFKCFPKKVVKDLTEILVDRNSLEISATKMREYLKNDDRSNWEKYANKKIYNEYENLKSSLLF